MRVLLLSLLLLLGADDAAAAAVVAFPFVFHTASGLRHLYWDTTAKGLDLKSVHQSSYAIIGVSLVGTIALAAYTID